MAANPQQWARPSHCLSQQARTSESAVYPKGTRQPLQAKEWPARDSSSAKDPTLAPVRERRRWGGQFWEMAVVLLRSARGAWTRLAPAWTRVTEDLAAHKEITDPLPSLPTFNQGLYLTSFKKKKSGVFGQVTWDGCRIKKLQHTLAVFNCFFMGLLGLAWCSLQCVTLVSGVNKMVLWFHIVSTLLDAK